jgi:glycosyltransferase involved in cell wall biosynthesis
LETSSEIEVVVNQYGSPHPIKVIVVAPFPPPFHGVAVMMQALSELKMDGIEMARFNLQFNKEYRDLETFRIRKIFLFIRYFILFVFRLISERYNVLIITHSFRFSAFFKDSIFILTAKLFGLKVIANARGQKFDRNFYDPLPWIGKIFVRFVFRKVDAVVSVGKKLIPEYDVFAKSRHDNFFTDYVHDIVPDSFDTLLQSKKKQENITVLYLSAVTTSKGIFVLLDAARLLKEKGEANIHFRVCGNFWDNKYPFERKLFLETLEKYSLNSTVTYVGEVLGDAKTKEYLAADIFVFPSLNDSFGIVNVEAMSAALPIIATPQGAVPEYLEDGTNGFLVPENDSAALAEKILRLARNEKLRSTIGINNRKKFLHDFSAEVFSDKWEMIFKRICKN